MRYFFKKNKKKIIWNTAIIAGSLLVFVLVLVMLNHQDRKQDSQQTQASRADVSVATTNDTIRVEIPVYRGEQAIVNSVVQEYMQADVTAKASDVIAGKWSEKDRSDISVPVELTYTVTGLPKGEKLATAVFQVSETDDFSASSELAPQQGSNSVLVYNLKRNTRYQYRVILTTESGIRVITQNSFITADHPRFLTVDGIRNVRDIGGWTTEDGKTVQQGLLYRGSEMDGREEKTYSLTSAGMATMQKELGIQMEIDLRGPGYQDSLGAGVQYFSCNMAEYDTCFKAEYGEEIRKLFAQLAKPENYPVYLHCTYGTDRTGTVCALLEALLGVKQDQLIRDYKLSVMLQGGLQEERFDDFLKELMKYEGDTLQNKAENYLLSVGVTQAEIDSIREIFLNP